MKARLANKILLGSEKKKNRYWLNRVVKAALGWKKTKEWKKHVVFIFVKSKAYG